MNLLALQGNSALVLGYAEGETATYKVNLPATFWTSWIGPEDLVTLSVSGSAESFPAREEDGSDAEPAVTGTSSPELQTRDRR